MNKKAMKRILAGILTMSMVLGIVVVGDFSRKVQTVKAETGETAGAETRTVNIQTNGDIAGITNPVAPTNETSAWSGSKVYFGKYNNNPVLFRVLDAKTTDYSADGTTQTMLLDSDTLFAAKKFNQGEANNSWASSDIKTWMQGTGANQFLNQFSAIEQGAIIASNKSEPSRTDGTITAGTSFVPLEHDTVFALDAVELKNTSYGYSDTEDAVINRIKKLSGNDNWWWTRSPYHNGGYVRFIHTTGKIANAGTPNVYEMSFNPAMNLNLSSILFTYVSGQDKTSSFTTTEVVDNNTWNLTLAGGKGFTTTLTDSAITVEEQIVLNVTDVGTDLNGNALANDFYSQLSAMLLDENGTVVAYGKVGDAITGNVSFDLPSGIKKGQYTLKVFAEKVNSSASSNVTDYASNMASFTLNVVETKSINLQINGDIVGITNPAKPIDTEAWSGSKVYFGKYKNSPVLFRVLDPKTTDYSADGKTETMLLDSDAVLKSMSFKADGASNQWADSDVEKWMNNTEDGFLSGFSVIEQGAIAASTKNSFSATDGSGMAGVNWSPLNGDFVFALDAKEVMNTSYGYSNVAVAVKNKIKNATSQETVTTTFWWLRSDETTQGLVGFVSDAGKHSNASSNTNYISVAPAFNLNLSSILYASASGLQPSSKLEAVGNEHVANNTWKLTLLDDSKTVGIQEGKSVYQKGTTVTVPYTYTYTGSDISQLSIMITSTERTDAAAEVLYYGALTTVTGEERSGTATFELPSDLPEGYRVYLLAEDVNEDNFTNYASEPVELGIVISEEHTKADFATFRDAMEAPTAPSGYVFAGWYYDEACKNTPVPSSTKELKGDTKVYAKFVPEAVLSVKAQPRYTEGTTNKIDLRLVTTVDSFKYSELGFEVITRAGTAMKYVQQNVYQSLEAAGVKYGPTFFDSCSIRFGTINITGITISGEEINLNRTIKTRAYWITLDGTTVYGPEREVKVSEAVAILGSAT